MRIEVFFFLEEVVVVELKRKQPFETDEVDWEAEETSVAIRAILWLSLMTLLQVSVL